MDFSNLLSKEIANKREQASRKRFKLSRTKRSENISSTDVSTANSNVNVNVVSTNSPSSADGSHVKCDVIDTLDDTGSRDQGLTAKNPISKSIETADGTKNDRTRDDASNIASITGNLGNNEEQTSPQVDNEKLLDSQLASFNIATLNLSQEQKIDKLRQIVKQEKYKRYLQLELELSQSPLTENDISLPNRHDLAIKIRIYLKNLIKQWELTNNQLELLKEIKIDVVNLLYKLRKQTVADDMVISLATIINYLQKRDFNQANQAYLKLSIGNVAWPIGIQNIGIHARSSQLKLVSKSANIMINDETRRWIVSIKRLITWVEKQTS
jgi:pre-mRNA-splicing factor 18